MWKQFVLVLIVTTAIVLFQDIWVLVYQAVNEHFRLWSVKRRFYIVAN